MTTRAEIRKEFEYAGYRASFKTNPLTSKLTTLTVTTPDGKFVVGGNVNVYGADQRTAHLVAFSIYNHHKGTVLSDTDQKIS